MMSSFFRSISLASAVLVLLAGSGVDAAQKQSSAPAPKSLAASGSEAAPGTLSGKVVETMNAGGYTYVCLEKAGKKTWVAMPERKVAVGSKMTVGAGQEMANFTSKTLNRTFESIIFTSGPVEAKQAGAHGAAAPAGAAGGSKAAAAPLDKGVKIEKAAGQNAYTVSEVFAGRKALNNKKVLVRAKVVKVSQQIMGRNWIHLQDGSGDPAKGTHNLVATSQEVPTVGDTVTIQGKVIKDKDFGSGYKYTVILEEAVVRK